MFIALLRILLTARHRHRSYQSETMAMESILEAINQLHIVEWENFDGEYDGYDGPTRSGPVDEETARRGLGKKGECKIPPKV